MIKRESTAPRDPFNLVYIIFIWLGIGSLLPWNFFITVHTYWMHKFRELDPELRPNSTTEYSPLQMQWGSYLSIASMVPNVLFLLLNAMIGHKFKVLPRLISALIVIIILFIFSVIMTIVDTDSWQKTFLAVTLFSVVLINVMVAFLQGGLIGLAAMFPPAYMNANIQGQAVGGIFAAATNVVVLALGVEPSESAFYCFLIAILFLTSALVAFAILRKSDFYKHYTSDTLSSEPELNKKLDGSANDDESNVNMFHVIRRIWIWMLAVYSTFMVTLATFPALTSIVLSTQSGSQWNTKYFIPVGCFLLFNVGDYLGRFLGGVIKWPRATPWGSIITLSASWLRVAFIPLFLFCNINPNGRVNSQVYFASDTAFLIFMTLFSISNGYLGSITMMFAPKRLSKPKEQMMAGSIMVTCLVSGLASGAGISGFLVKLI